MQHLLLFYVVLCLSDWTHSQSQIIHSTLPYSFTFAATNMLSPRANTNLTGVPLVLGQDGASTGISFYVTSTYSSFPYNDYPALGLVDNALRAYQPSGRWATNATAVESGGPLGWATSTFYTSPAAKVYSILQSPAHEFPILAAYGISTHGRYAPFLVPLGKQM